MVKTKEVQVNSHLIFYWAGINCAVRACPYINTFQGRLFRPSLVLVGVGVNGPNEIIVTKDISKDGCPIM